MGGEPTFAEAGVNLSIGWLVNPCRFIANSVDVSEKSLRQLLSIFAAALLAETENRTQQTGKSGECPVRASRMNALERSFAICAVILLSAGPTASAAGGKVADDPIEVAQLKAPPVAPSAQVAPENPNGPEKAFFEEFGGLLRFDSLGRDGMSYLVFATASGIVSVLAFLLDVASCIASGNRKGFLGVTHGLVSFLLVVVWFIGGAIAGALGYLVRIFDASPIAAVIAGLTWTTFLNRLASFAQRQLEDKQKT